MRFLSVCSGIEAASVAWEPLGWQASGFAEIEPFPCAVLAHHYPDVPNHGDMTLLPAKIRAGEVEAPDLLCGGTPCQAFSVAGLRQSLDDARGNLTLTFCEIADAIDAMRKQPSIVFWENVPGVLNTKDNAFGCFLGALAGEDDALVAPGGRWANAGFVDGPQRAVAWRVLDAQYFGVAQRRRRVFVVASARADFDPAAILFEFEGVRRDSAPSREKGQKATGGVGSSVASGKSTFGTLMANAGTKLWLGNQEALTGDYHILQSIALAENTIGRQPHNGGNGDGFTEGGPMYTLNATGVHGVAHTFDMKQHHNPQASDTVQLTTQNSAFVRGDTPLVAQLIPFDTTQITSPQNGSNPKAGDPCHPLAAGAHIPAIAQPIAFQSVDFGADATSDLSPTLRRHDPMAVAAPTLTASNDPSRSPQSTEITNQVAAVHAASMAVRRLTPVECERLQGFPDNYTNIPWRKADQSPDGPRYKALGNSWAVPVVRWIGERIERSLG